MSSCVSLPQPRLLALDHSHSSNNNHRHRPPSEPSDSEGSHSDEDSDASHDGEEESELVLKPSTDLTATLQLTTLWITHAQDEEQASGVDSPKPISDGHQQTGSTGEASPLTITSTRTGNLSGVETPRTTKSQPREPSPLRGPSAFSRTRDGGSTTMSKTDAPQQEGGQEEAGEEGRDGDAAHTVHEVRWQSKRVGARCQRCGAHGLWLVERCADVCAALSRQRWRRCSNGKESVTAFATAHVPNDAGHTGRRRWRWR